MNNNEDLKTTYAFNIDLMELTVTISKIVNNQIVENMWFDNDNGDRFTSNAQAYEFAEKKVKQLESQPDDNQSIILSKYQFLSLFTNEELANLYSLAKTDINVEVIMSLFNAANEIDMNEQRVQDAFAFFNNQNIISSDRIDEIIQEAILKSNQST